MERLKTVSLESEHILKLKAVLLARTKREIREPFGSCLHFVRNMTYQEALSRIGLHCVGKRGD